MILFSTGCTSLLTPMEGTPVSHLPAELLGIRRSEYVNVPAVMLAVQPSDHYQLDEGDILGVYIESVLPFSSPTAIPQPPPVHFPDSDSVLPPSVGFPIAVQEDGMLSLPLIDPFSVKRMTIDQARTKIKEKYIEKDVLASKNIVPIVTLIRERTYNVTVLRESARQGLSPNDQSARGTPLKLPAYQNDLLHALTLTGGLPGVNEKSEVTIFKTSRIPLHLRTQLMAELASGSCQCIEQPELECYSADPMMIDTGVENQYVIKVPLRVPPNRLPTINPRDVELAEGDIVYVESRESELFYTGGLLRGGQFPIPRDYDLDVLGAMALAGMGIDSQGGSAGGIGGGVAGLGGAKPTQLFVIRKLPSGRTFNIAVDLQLALNSSAENILVQPGDTLVLRYKPHEELLNFGLGTFFTYGISQLFNQNR
ncbi:polysaccharide biosynthesis/export family protein [Novipirellula artificiosorum]|uniref:polysaccharide biosynthesis/export family protein n=1 Tax=Novipirellula artificiosorum TaxID=2528016 RepID=UPI001E419D37|nr:polysaccharide biosynthesis/export family protein [Novipirellula artificiosorum]